MSAEATRAAYQRLPHDTLTIPNDDRDRPHRHRRSPPARRPPHHRPHPPFRDGTRRERPARMGVMISHTPADEIDVHVLEYARGTDHTHLNGIYIGQLNRALLAVDYDGPTPLLALGALSAAPPFAHPALST